MALNPRVFYVDEDNAIHRVAWTWYSRLLKRKETVPFFAGKSVHLIDVTVETDEHGEERIVRACFIKANFDKHGLWSLAQQTDELREAMQMVLPSSQDNQAKLNRLEPFCWKPTRDIVDRLSEMVRLQKKHG